MNLPSLIFPFDYIILLIFILIIFFCTWKGFIQSLLSLLTWVGSILITIYSYNSFANFLSKQILIINFFKNYDYLSNVIGIIVSIPIIFLISLFVLKKIRKFLSADLDKQILGIIFDKFFGLIYGLIFSYVIFSTILFASNKFGLERLNLWMTRNSYVLSEVDNFNNNYIINFIPMQNID